MSTYFFFYLSQNRDEYEKRVRSQASKYSTSGWSFCFWTSNQAEGLNILFSITYETIEKREEEAGKNASLLVVSIIVMEARSISFVQSRGASFMEIAVICMCTVELTYAARRTTAENLWSIPHLCFLGWREGMG